MKSVDKKVLLTVSAWVIIFLISDLPDIFFVSLSGQIPDWLFHGKLFVLIIFLAICVFVNVFRPLLEYAFIMLVFYIALLFSQWVKNSIWWSGIFYNSNSSFTLYYLDAFILDLFVALTVIAGLWLLFRYKKKFYLAKGNLSAPIEQVRWLGIRKGESWKKFGWIFAVAASVCVLIPTIMLAQPSANMFIYVIPLLPAVLLFAAVNAFTEEVYYRLSLLSTLLDVIGKTNTLLINAVFFGLAHYLYGSPPGIIGFLMTAFLAWLMGKSILETKGVFWAWTIHFLPDVVIFTSYALMWTKT